jgi:hypothetical protein
MAMRSARQRCGWGGVLLIAVFGCLGGQTGQPTVGTCDSRTLDLDEPVRGVTPSEFMAAFEGVHVVPLSWNVSGGAGIEDQLTLELRRRDGATPFLNCGNGLEVTMDLSLTTRDYGVLERREIVVSGGAGQLEEASILVRGARVTLDADLAVVDGEVRIAGTLTTSDNALPAPTATFPSAGSERAAGAGE